MVSFKINRWYSLLFSLSSVTAIVTLIRLMGWLQPAEWAAYDRLFKFRSQEPQDERIVIVGLEESDIDKLKQYPLSDKILATLLTKIKAQSPKVIGLDIFRDIPVPPGHLELTKVFQTTPNLIGIEKIVGDQSYPKIAPPPALKAEGKVAATDVIIDADGVLRRALLYPVTDGSAESAIPTLGLALALEYLAAEEIQPVPSQQGGWLQLKNMVFYPFRKNDGGYVNTDDSGYQILINWRGKPRSFKMVSISEVLENKIDPNLFKDKVVLIGSVAISIKDFFYTPYNRGLTTTSTQTYGVEIQANIASQIISTVKDNKPLIKTVPEPLEYTWIIFWIFLAVAWVNRLSSQTPIKLILLSSSGAFALSFILIASVYFPFLTSALWLPVVPSLLGLWGGTLTMVGCIYIIQLQETNSNLEKLVESRTKELKETYVKLFATQQQIQAQEKLAFVGVLTSGITHEIKNPLNLISNFVEIAENVANELQAAIEGQDNLAESSHDLVLIIGENLDDIQGQVQRINKIIDLMLFQPHEINQSLELLKINEILYLSFKLVHQSKKNEDFLADLDLVQQFDQSIQDIKGTGSELTQVFVNIIDNAYEAVADKKLQLVSEYTPQIILATKNLENFLEISITDNGNGIPEHTIDKIFQHFFTTKASGKGTGLGLAIAHDIIVGKYAGSITVETEEGKFSRFIVRLPFRLLNSG